MYRGISMPPKTRTGLPVTQRMNASPPPPSSELGNMVRELDRKQLHYTKF